MVDVDIYVLSHLKEKLAWVVDKKLRVISTSYNLILKSIRVLQEAKRNLRIKPLKILEQYCIRCYVALSNVS